LAGFLDHMYHQGLLDRVGKTSVVYVNFWHRRTGTRIFWVKAGRGFFYVKAGRLFGGVFGPHVPSRFVGRIGKTFDS